MKVFWDGKFIFGSDDMPFWYIKDMTEQENLVNIQNEGLDMAFEEDAGYWDELGFVEE